MAILLVEQFYDFAAELADHYLVMSRGEIVQQGPRCQHGSRRRARTGGDLKLAVGWLARRSSHLTVLTAGGWIQAPSTLRKAPMNAPAPTALFTPSWQAELELAYGHDGAATRGPRCAAIKARCGCKSTCTPKALHVCQHIIVHPPPGGIAGGDRLAISRHRRPQRPGPS